MTHPSLPTVYDVAAPELNRAPIVDPMTRSKTTVTLRDLFGAGSIVALDERALGRSMQAFGIGQSPRAVTVPAGVGVVSVMGPLFQRGARTWFGDIAGYDRLADAFVAACADPSVEAILLHIDSPGGMVAGCFEAVRRMQEARDASGKPVVAFADELAASAAYAVACVADAGIMAPASAEVGSVGVLLVHMSEARALEEFGIDVTVFRSGDRKAEGAWFEQLTEEAQAALQAGVDENAQLFAKLVSKARGRSTDEIVGWRGAVFGAAEAVKLGVADRVASFEEAAAAALKEARKRRKEKAMSKAMAAIMGILGLAEGASEEAVTAAVTVAKSAEAERDRLVAAVGASSVEDAIGQIEGLVAKAAEHEKLQREKADLEAAKKRADAEELVRQGREAGKITAATANDWLEDAMANIERTRGKLSRAPVVIDREGPEEKKGARDASGKVWEDFSAEEKIEMQEKEPDRFALLLSEFRARTGRSR